jgi:hypothetical protein
MRHVHPIYGSRFHVLRSQICFGRYRRRCVPFSYFALPESFWAGTKVPGQVFMFYALTSILNGIKSAGSGTVTSRTVQVCCLRCGLVGSFSPTNKLGLIIEKIYIKCPNTVARCPELFQPLL